MPMLLEVSMSNLLVDLSGGTVREIVLHSALVFISQARQASHYLYLSPSLRDDPMDIG